MTIFAKDIRLGRNVISLAVTAVISLVSYITFGLLGGLAVHYLTHSWQWNGDSSGIK